jgi:hypothetical protein
MEAGYHGFVSGSGFKLSFAYPSVRLAGLALYRDMSLFYGRDSA